MPLGKPAGVACVQLDGNGRCRLFNRPERPAVCSSLQPSAEMCGDDRAHALHWLARLEGATAPTLLGPGHLSAQARLTATTHHAAHTGDGGGGGP